MRKMFMLCLGVGILGGGPKEASGPIPVDSVDLTRYAGTWYEIARLPNRFQRKCARNTTATYTLRNDGRITVVNRCITSDSDEIDAVGVARIVDTSSNAELEVSFFKIFGWHLFWGDYWIIGLEEDYQFAVIGTPSRKYGWILGRSRKLTPGQREAIDTILRHNGYDPDKFIPTVQE